MFEVGKKKYTDNGIWVEYEGAEFLIGRAGTIEFMKATENLNRPHKRRIDKGTLPAEIVREIGLRAVARAVLLDWKGISIDGKETPYSEDAGVLALENNPDLMEFVTDTALNNSLYAEQVESKIVKKSPPQ